MIVSGFGFSKETTMISGLTPPKVACLPFNPKKYLQDKFNIPKNRMIIKAYGSKKSIADKGDKKAAPKAKG
jgi:hypothetical protein